MAALNTGSTGVIWFDAHGDCETPETTVSGFLDGMGLSLLLSKCWQNLLSSLKLNNSLQGENIVLAGARDLSEHEKNFIQVNNIRHITVEENRKNKNAIKAACVEFVKSGIEKIHLHIDADVIDPSVAVANSYVVEKGFNKEEITEIINSCGAMLPFTSLTIASYDPLFDTDKRMLKIIQELIYSVINNFINCNT